MWPVLLLPALANLRSEEMALSAEERMNVAAVVNTGEAMGAEAARALAKSLRTAPPALADKLRKLAAAVAWEGKKADQVVKDLRVRAKAEGFLRKIALSGIPLFGKAANLLPGALNPGTLGFDRRTHNVPSSLLQFDGSDFDAEMPQTPVLDFSSGSVYDPPAKSTFDSLAIAEARGLKQPTVDEMTKKNNDIETLFQQNLAIQQRDGYKSQLDGFAVSPTLDDEVLMTGPLADMAALKEAINKPLDDLSGLTEDEPENTNPDLDLKAAERKAQQKLAEQKLDESATPLEEAALSATSKTDLDGFPTMDGGRGAKAISPVGASLLQQHLKTAKVIGTAVQVAVEKKEREGAHYDTTAKAAPSSLLEERHSPHWHKLHDAKLKEIANLAAAARLEAKMKELLHDASKPIEYPSFDDVDAPAAPRKAPSSLAQTGGKPHESIQARAYDRVQARLKELQGEMHVDPIPEKELGSRGLLYSKVSGDPDEVASSFVQRGPTGSDGLVHIKDHNDFEKTLHGVEAKLQQIRDRIAKQQAEASKQLHPGLASSLLQDQASASPAALGRQADIERRKLHSFEAEAREDRQRQDRALDALEQKLRQVNRAADAAHAHKWSSVPPAGRNNKDPTRHKRARPSSLLQDPDDMPFGGDDEKRVYRAADTPRQIPIPEMDAGATLESPTVDGVPIPTIADPNIAPLSDAPDASDPKLDEGDDSSNYLKAKLEVASNAKEGQTELPMPKGVNPKESPELHSAKQWLSTTDWKNEVLEAKQQAKRDREMEPNFPNLPKPSIGADGQPDYNDFIGDINRELLDGVNPGGGKLRTLAELEADQKKQEAKLTQMFGTDRNTILAQEAMDPEEISQKLRQEESYEQQVRPDGSVMGGRAESRHQRDLDRREERRERRHEYEHEHHHHHHKAHHRRWDHDRHEFRDD